MRNFNSKKAQISLFVIIGLVLVIGVFLFFVLQAPKSQEAQLLDSVKDADATIKPVQDYVESCLESVTLESLQLLGAHGGYIDPVGVNSRKPFTYDRAKPVDSEGVFFADIDDYFIPYWFHSKAPSPNLNLEPVIVIPTIEEMQLDHQNYVQQNLYACINNFEAFSFKDADIKITDEVPIISIVYTDDGVVSKAEFETKVILENGEKSVDSYIASFSIPIKKYYLLASEITYHELNNQYLEKITLLLIGRYSRASADALPPFADHISSYEPVIWSQQAVKLQLQELLQTYIPVINVFGSELFFTMNTSALSLSEQAFFNQFTIGGNTFLTSPNIDVTHTYFPQDYYLKINPSEGDLLSPKYQDFAESFGEIHGQSDPEQFYNFFYDVSYPVVVSIHEDDVSGSESFTFNFALESNIRFNKLWTDFAEGNGPLEWDSSWVEVTVDPSVAEFDDFGSESESIISTQINSPEAVELFHDPDQLLSGNVSVAVIDSYTKQPLKDVYVSAGIGSFTSKLLGKTVFDNEFNVSYFSGKAPLLMNGYIELRKEGYEPVAKQISTKQGVDLNLGLFEMNRLQEINTSIKVLDMASNSIQEKEIADSVFITLTKLTKPSEKSFSQTIIFRTNESSAFTTLIPGRYVFEGFFLSDEGITIPAKCKRTAEFPNNLLLSEDKRWIPEEPVIMKPMMWGGVDFGEDMPWKLSGDVLYENNSLEFTVLKFPPPLCFDDMDKLSKVDYYSNKYRSQLLPKIIEIEQSIESEFDPEINPDFMGEQ